jgi:beta-lactamase superfamily II metal-dependent hydrolase
MLARRSGLRSLIVVILAVAVLGGCSRKAPVVGPEPIKPGDVLVDGNRVDWATSGGARGSVRYGFTPPKGAPPQFSFDHMAYPDAHGRLDRAFLTDHSVALLDLQPGRTVYYQTMSEAPGAAAVYSPPDSFVAAIGPPQGLLTSTMIHIGFGDSHLITMPTTGKRFLIDAGYREAETSVEGYLQQHGVTSIDAMLATHVHEDHLGGIVGSRNSNTDGVLNTYPPPVFFDSPSKSGNSLAKPAYRELLQSFAAPTRTLILNRGDSSRNLADLALDPEVYILCLNSGIPPGYVQVGYEGTNINNESIVMLFQYGDVDFVIGGDAEDACEGSMLQGWPAATLEVEYFKAMHHGLSDANAAAWVNTLKPRVAFIPNTRQVWDPPNEFEGAIASTVSKLEGIGSHIYVIDEARALGKTRPALPGNGFQYNVSFVTDGSSYEVRLEIATQTVPKVTAQSFACVQHALHPNQQLAPASGVIDGDTP